MYEPLETVIPLLQNQGHNINDPWDVVKIFEEKIANYAGSKYAIALDNCTDAIFLCLKYLKAEGKVTIPSRTFCSVPMTIKHAGCQVEFEDLDWEGVYQLNPYPIFDSATRFTKGMYISGSFQCLSFHLKKVLKIGKGGMILTDDKDAYEWFYTASKMGRHIENLYKDDYFDILGWNMFMPPEQAARGIMLFEELPEQNDDVGGSWRYHSLEKYEIFKN
tara:strand:- start:34 stop:690 length:657 start_codon:yes stop_codon:yes gene_type:complete